jgi:chromosome segregation ATPase
MATIAELRQRLEALSLEIRHYPTPIARCDDQLAGLIEQRARLRDELEALESREACGPDARWTNDGGMNAA